MHLPTTLFLILATLLHTVLSTPLLPRDDRPVEPASTTVILGTFLDSYCLAGQKDYSGGLPSWTMGDPEPFYGACQVLSGMSLKIWWTIQKSRCPTLLAERVRDKHTCDEKAEKEI
ncbi:hypothetical protein FB567DRAFT_555276 [Paraphoma chrysanthemicola]|uniref:Uncharacterized protein n=1 Tax=Paraphoma chrysanthemicola TaxID=798071 RepID=A0A8K0VSF8_9PLEO|nr:hypothetical protein FB567DRAFT_555276 [Paraphoma chrysanthemicola]